MTYNKMKKIIKRPEPLRISDKYKQMQPIRMAEAPNIQNEVIQSLLKQIHFLNLQVKLIREKSHQSKGNGLMSLLTRETAPPVEHIFQSNKKFKEMKDHLTQQLNRQQIMNVKLQDQNLALKSKKYLLRKLFDEEEQKQKIKQVQSNKFIQEMTAKINSQEKKTQLFLKETQNSKKMVNQSLTIINKYRKAHQIKSVNDKLNAEIQQSQKQFQLSEIAYKKQKLAKLKEDILTRKENVTQDNTYLKEKQQQNRLTNSLNDIQSQIYKQSTKSQMLRGLLSLYSDQRDQQIVQKNILTQEFQKLKVVLEDTSKIVQTKIKKELKSRQMESMEIRKSQTALHKLEKQMSETNKKAEKAVQTTKKYRQETKNSQLQLKSLKEQVSKLKEQVQQLSTSHQEKISQKDDLTTEQNDLTNKKQMLTEQLERSRQLYNQAFEEHEYLKTKLTFLQQNIHFPEYLKKFRGEDLHQMIENSKETNSAVQQLLRQWDIIRNFSRNV